MRVLLLNHEFTISGASLMLYRVARHLVKQGWAVDVVSLLPTEGPLAARYAEAGVSIVKRVKPSRYRLCIANTIYAGSAVASLGSAIGTAWWIHEADNGLSVALGDPEVWQRAFSSAARILFPARFLAENTYKSFVRQLPAQRIVVLPGAVELPESIEPAEKSATFRVVSVGSVYELKRQGDVLEALGALGVPGLEAVFVGELNSLSERGLALLAEDRKRGTGRFRFLGALAHEQAMAWLASADLFVHPSGSESQGLAPLEAGLLGKAVVLADIPAYEGIWRHEFNCLMHPVGDCKSLAAQISRLHRDPMLRQRLGGEARRTARRFSEEAFLKRFDELVLAGF
jgi:glycosyltransferase involved in cell wall biosynthesis